jgi:hypothetical protein
MATTDVHTMLHLYHEAAEGLDGVFKLVSIHAGTGRVAVNQFDIGDVDAMAAQAVAWAEHGNVYMPPAVIRRDLAPGKRGTVHDINAVLGLVVDDDRDTGRTCNLPGGITPTCVVTTCSQPEVNRHIHFAFTQPLLPCEAAPLADLLHSKCGGDFGSKDIAHVWRLPGTRNHPNAAKIKRGRPVEPQSVELAGGSLQRMDAGALRQALEGMPDHRTAQAQPHGVAERRRIMERLPGRLRGLIEAEGEGDRSAHCFRTMLALMEHGLNDPEIRLLADGAPFARKFVERGDLDPEIARVRTKHDGSTVANIFAERQAPINADNIPVDPDLAMMNARYAVVRIGGKTRVAFMENSPAHPGCEIPVYSSLSDFRAFHENPKKVIEVNERPKQVSLGTWWLRHEHRRQCERVVFDPGAAPNPVELNLWRGFAVEPDDSGDCSLYLAHATDVICSNDDEHATYLLDFLAWGVQNPGKRAEVAIVLRGDEGTGKGTLVHAYGSLFGTHYSHISQPGHLVGNFNAHLQQTRVLFADEAFFAGDRRQEGVLKSLITEPQIKIEPKGVDAFTVPNMLMIFMASNNDWVVPAGASARRYFVLDVSEARKQDHAYFDAIEKELDNGGRAALLHFLLSRDLTAFNIRDVPQTRALADQKARSRRGVDLLVELLAADGVLPNAHATYPHVVITSGEHTGDGFWPSARKIVPELKHQSPRVIGRTLKETWGCEPWASHGQSGLKFPPLQELRAAFEAKHGKQDWDSRRKTWGENILAEDQGT